MLAGSPVCAACHVAEVTCGHQRFLKRGVRQFAHVAIQIDGH
jgi:hypothetical protein